MGDHPTTYYLVCLHRQCNQEAADFVAGVLSNPQKEGGAELVVRQETDGKDDGLIIHVSATRQRILELAETMGIKKPDLKNGVMREFRVSQSEDFGDTGVVGPLTLSDIHRCVLHAMESVHFDAGRNSLPGYVKKRIMKRSPVLDAYRQEGLIDTFPLHEIEALKRLYTEWSTSPLLSPPVEAVRDYFGENVALYISFVAFYTQYLIPTAFLGLLQLVADKTMGYAYYNDVAFALLNVIVSAVFLESWKRRSNEHAYRWGTGGKLRHKRPRPEFRGDCGINSVTGREEIRYPMGKTIRKIIFVSLPVTLVCLLIAFALMLFSFESEKWMYDAFRDPETGQVMSDSLFAQVCLYTPSVTYSALVFLMNLRYLHLAHHLTEWENHRTQDQFEHHVVAKLVLFESVNSFLSLFYIAFYLRDLAMLKSQVFTMLLVQQIINQVQETLLPVLLRRPSTKKVITKFSKRFTERSVMSSHEHCCHNEVVGMRFVGKLDEDDEQIAHAIYSLKKDPYESTYDDFMELWLQFGSVFLFSSVYPAAALFALFNNFLELRMDAFKLCKIARKPTPRGVRDIGAWYTAFNITATIGIITNCALMAMDTKLREAFGAFGLADFEWVMLFVILEHFLILTRLLVDKLIPDVPTNIKMAIDRDDFVLKNE